MRYNSEVCDFWAKKYTYPVIFQVVSIPIVRIWNFALGFSMRIYSIFAQAYLKRMTWFSEKVGWNSRYILRKFHQKSLMAWLWKLIKFVFNFENDFSRVFNFQSFHLSIFSFFDLFICRSFHFSVFSLSIFSFSIFSTGPQLIK
jgi:hypothetical protein